MTSETTCRRSFVFSIEALLSLAAADALAGYSLAGAGTFYGEFHAAQLVQDLLEVSVKNPENARAIAEFAAGNGGGKAFLEEKYSKILGQLGNYCLDLEADGKEMKANCIASAPGSGGNEGSGTVVSGERIFFDGNRFFTVRLSLGLNR
ncbi:MAG: hypothetical protein NTY90_04140 [Candidatus Micrarchaeota archaeon]|nr:hypothetical protein [Candidatus Micrarchaeota archaeon]